MPQIKQEGADFKSNTVAIKVAMRDVKQSQISQRLARALKYHKVNATVLVTAPMLALYSKSLIRLFVKVYRYTICVVNVIL